MKTTNLVILLVIAGIVGILAALWSGTGAGLGPVRMGEGGPTQEARNTVMVLTLIGGVGALLTAATIKVIGPKILGIAALVFGALMIPSLLQANILALLSIFLLAFAAYLLLTRPRSESRA